MRNMEVKVLAPAWVRAHMRQYPNLSGQSCLSVFLFPYRWPISPTPIAHERMIANFHNGDVSVAVRAITYALHLPKRYYERRLQMQSSISR